jgi:hypothetical protein
MESGTEYDSDDGSGKSKLETDNAVKYKLLPPKRSSATVSGIASRYDKLNTSIHNQTKVQLTDSMLNFLGKPISTSSSSASECFFVFFF